MRIAARTDIGLVRENNQDSYTAGELCEGTAFAVVCDGMGGAAEGALASRSAVKVIREKLSSGFSEGMSDIAVKSLLISALENVYVIIAQSKVIFLFERIKIDLTSCRRKRLFILGKCGSQ